MKMLQTQNQQKLGIHFVMFQHGWAQLQFHLNEEKYLIDLSDVFDPFEDLMSWLADISSNRLPTQIKINEEGFISLLHIDKYDDKQIQFSIQNAENNEIFMKIICCQATFAQQFRAEFIRFFQEDFDPNHWGNRSFDSDEDNVYYDLKNIVLTHYQVQNT